MGNIVDLKEPKDIYKNIRKYPDIIEDLKIWQLKMALDYSQTVSNEITSRYFNYPDKVMQDEKMAKAIKENFDNDSEFKINESIKRLIKLKISNLKQTKEKESGLVAERDKRERHGGEEDAKPTEKRDWLETEYKKNRDNFRTDEKWAEHTASKFQKEFKTKEKPSPTSMKRYGIYKGLN